MKRVMRALRTYVITGIVILLPVAITLYLFWLVFSITDSALGTLVVRLVGRRIPGAGLVLTLLLVFGLGIFATNVVGRKIIVFLERLVTRIPVVRNIYNAAKQLVDAFTRPGANGFKQVVMLRFPGPQLYSIGFLTNYNIMPEFSAETGTQLVSVFVPTTPNPTTGFFVMVPRDEVVFLDMSVEDAFKMMISAGVISPNAFDDSSS